MKKILTLLASLAFIFFIGRAFFTDHEALYLKNKQISYNHLKDFSFIKENKQVISLHHFSQKIIILNFWAPWCAPCKKEFPFILKTLNEIKFQNIHFIALAMDSSWKDIHSFLKPFQKELASLKGKVSFGESQLKKISKELNITKLPKTYILTQDKIIKEINDPREWEDPDMKAFLQMLFSVTDI